MAEGAIPRSGGITVRAMLLGERINTSGLERTDVLAKVPLAFRIVVLILLEIVFSVYKILGF